MLKFKGILLEILLLWVIFVVICIILLVIGLTLIGHAFGLFIVWIPLIVSTAGVGLGYLASTVTVLLDKRHK